MSIHILVPQERLAELLKAEHELTLAKEFGFHTQFSWHMAMKDPNLDHPDRPTSKDSDYYQEPLDDFCARVNSLVEANNLGQDLGYEYTVSTDADYFANLEDMLGDEE